MPSNTHEFASHELSALATTPQALDNQYLPDKALALLLEDDPFQEELEVAAVLRDASMQREWIRCLLYSPQVFINRAFAINHPSVLAGLRQEPESFAALFEDDRIVVHLLNNSVRKSGATKREDDLPDVLEDPPFDIAPHAEQIWKGYLSAGHPTRYLRLTEAEDAQVVDRFPALFKNISYINSAEAEQLLLGLRGFEPDPDTVDDFRVFCEHEITGWLRSDDRTSRGALYARFVLPDGVPTNTVIVDPKKPFSHEMKLLSDLAYNHNVPTTIGRHSFIPTGLPDPRCLPPSLYARREPRTLASGVGDILEEVTVAAQEEFIYESQSELVVPDWAALSLNDVLTIQGWPEWREMTDRQRELALFESTAEFRIRLTEYGNAVVTFQEKLGALTIESGWRTFSKELLKLTVKPVVLLAGKPVTPASARDAISRGQSRLSDLTIDTLIDFTSQRKLSAWRRDRRASVRSAVSRVKASDEVMTALDRIASRESNPDVQIEDVSKLAN